LFCLNIPTLLCWVLGWISAIDACKLAAGTMGEYEIRDGDNDAEALPKDRYLYVSSKYANMHTTGNASPECNVAQTAAPAPPRFAMGLKW
jgi:hypothetical protein